MEGRPRSKCFMELGRGEYQDLTRVEMENYVNWLMMFPSMTRREVAAWCDRSMSWVSKLTSAARKRGKPRRLDGPGQLQGTDWPSEEELRWRLMHQTDEEILSKYGEQTSRIVVELGFLEDLSPEQRLYFNCEPLESGRRMGDVLPELGLIDEGDEEYVELVQGTSHTIRVIGTEVTFQLEAAEEMQAVNRLAAHLTKRYDIRGSTWEVTRPAIEFHMQLLRWWRTADRKNSKSLSDFGDLVLRGQQIINAIDLPEIQGRDEYEVLRKMVKSAPKLLEERGYRDAVACPQCGTVLRTYLVVYRRVVESLDTMARAAVALEAGEITPSAAAGLLRKTLTQVKEDPIFELQARELGCAFCGEGLKILQEIAERGEALREEDVVRVMAAMLEIGEAALAPWIPYSPRSRTIIAEDGTVSYNAAPV